MSCILGEFLLGKHETPPGDQSSADKQEISAAACASGSESDKIRIHVKKEELILGNSAFSYKIPKEELLLQEDEIVVKEESQERLCDLMPLPTEEIYVKDEFIPQPPFTASLKGISKINNSYSCDVCQYQSMDIMKLKTHMVLHIKEKPYKCFECDYRISTKFDLTLHILNQHSEIFRCKQCKYTTVAPLEMQQHTMVHNVEEEEHMKILAAEKPFKCGQCEYRTAKEYFLKKHNMLKHLPENCFKCKKCRFGFLLKSQFQEHMKTHKKRKKVD